MLYEVITVTGAASGAVGGFVNGTGNGLLGGSNLNDALLKGGHDALIGAVFGGIMGGIDAANNPYRDQSKLTTDRSFWTGKGKDNVLVKMDPSGKPIFGNEDDLLSSEYKNLNYATKKTQAHFQTKVTPDVNGNA